MPSTARARNHQQKGDTPQKLMDGEGVIGYESNEHTIKVGENFAFVQPMLCFSYGAYGLT
jgi:hypothetical protein